jgi:PHP family Zn ribbon phosphoesterase
MKLEELLEQKFLTVDGKKTIPELTKMYGNPIAVMKYAKVEALTGLTSKPTVIVERFIDGELHYTKDIVVRGIGKSLLVKMDHGVVRVEYIRHSMYNPEKMVRATEKEIMVAGAK